MAIALVVVQPFASYAKGDRITDAAKVADLLKDHDNRVVKITISDVLTEPPANTSKS